VFVGGISAATGMVIVETIALSTMVCNDLVMPILLRWKRLDSPRAATSPRCCSTSGAARSSGSCCWATSTSSLAGEAYALVSIGLISFAAVAQFAPASLGGLYWKGGTRNGRARGLSAGSRVVLHAAPAGVRQVRLVRHGVVETGSSASSCCSPTRSSACAASTRSPTR
jgi:Na+/proline symporter